MPVIVREAKKQDKIDKLLKEVSWNVRIRRLERVAKMAEVEREAGHGIR